jgi:hypothetical protein
MTRVIFKTLFSSPNEVAFIRMNLLETEAHVDQFIVCEFDRTHTGQPRDFLFENFRHEFSESEWKRITYIKAEIGGMVKDGFNNSENSHYNEDVMRGYFIRVVDIESKDIVISVDADEIIFSRCYPDIINSLGFFTRAVKLELNQFFYRLDYLWLNERFIAPTVCYGSYYKKQNSRWRYDGKLYKGVVGTHFSWCIPIDDMVKKITTNAHQNDYAKKINYNVMRDAVANKSYPFDDREFKILSVNTNDFPNLYPSSINKVKSMFDGIGEEQI